MTLEYVLRLGPHSLCPAASSFFMVRRIDSARSPAKASPLLAHAET